MAGRISGPLRRRLAPIRLLVLDVDGVLAEGRLLYSARGEELKAFSVRDGLGLRLLLDAGLGVAVVSGRASAAVAARMLDLGVPPEMVVQGSRDKAADLDALETRLGLADAEVAAMGDDLPDLPLLARVGFAACPADAAPAVASVCHRVCAATGGNGAVREVAELLLEAQGRWDQLVARWACPPARR